MNSTTAGTAAATPSAAFPTWSDTLRDGTSVRIRPIGKDDKEAEREFIEALSPESRRLRFLGQMRHPSEKLLEALTDIDHIHEVAFAATMPGEQHDRFIGVSRYSTDSTGANCECAVTVDDRWHDRGLGTVLMKHLIEVARSRGIATMYSIDSAENAGMHDLAGHLGFHCHRDPDNATQVIHELRL